MGEVQSGVRRVKMTEAKHHRQKVHELKTMKEATTPNYLKY